MRKFLTFLRAAPARALVWSLAWWGRAGKVKRRWAVLAAGVLIGLGLAGIFLSGCGVFSRGRTSGGSTTVTPAGSSAASSGPSTRVEADIGPPFSTVSPSSPPSPGAPPADATGGNPYIEQLTPEQVERLRRRRTPPPPSPEPGDYIRTIDPRREAGVESGGGVESVGDAVGIAMREGRPVKISVTHDGPRSSVGQTGPGLTTGDASVASNFDGALGAARLDPDGSVRTGSTTWEMDAKADPVARWGGVGGVGGVNTLTVLGGLAAAAGVAMLFLGAGKVGIAVAGGGAALLVTGVVVGRYPWVLALAGALGLAGAALAVYTAWRAERRRTALAAIVPAIEKSNGAGEVVKKNIAAAAALRPAAVRKEVRAVKNAAGTT